MNILITVISIIGAIIILLLLVALFAKKEYTVERETVINQPRSQVFNYIRLLKNQDQYSVWNQIDPGMQKTYTGTDGTVGFRYAWDSSNKKAGKGEQSIMAIREEERIDMDLHFIKPFEGKANAYMTSADAAGNATRVLWGVHGKMNYPMNLMLLLMNMEKMMGNDLSRGLDNLKALLEKK